MIGRSSCPNVYLPLSMSNCCRSYRRIASAISPKSGGSLGKWGFSMTAGFDTLIRTLLPMCFSARSALTARLYRPSRFRFRHAWQRTSIYTTLHGINVFRPTYSIRDSCRQSDNRYACCRMASSLRPFPSPHTCSFRSRGLPGVHINRRHMRRGR